MVSNIIRRPRTLVTLALLLTIGRGIPSEAQACPDSQDVYLKIGPKRTDLVRVGCRLTGSGALGDCSQASPGDVIKVPSSGQNGNCYLCLQNEPVTLRGVASTPKEWLDRGAIGFFRQLGRGGSPYAVDLDCLERAVSCENLWSFYKCQSCVGVGKTAIATWRFDDSSKEFWFGAESQAGGSSHPPFRHGVRNAAVGFASKGEILRYDDGALPLGQIADGDFSVEGWIRTESRGVQVVASKRSGSTWTGGSPGPDEDRLEDGARDYDCRCPTDGSICGLQVITAYGRLGIQISHGGTWRNFLPKDTPEAFIADGDWHHFAVTVDRNAQSGLVFYVDGVRVGTDDPTPYNRCVTNEAPLFIGGQTESTSFAFIGELDELSFYDRVLAPNKIKGIHEAANHGHCFR